MATFTAFSAFDSRHIPSLNEDMAQLLAQSATTFSFTDGHITNTYSSTNFTFAGNEIASGTATGWAMSVDGSPLFAVTGASYITAGAPGSPDAVVGHDIWDGGYLHGSGHPVYAEQADLAWFLRGDDTINGSAEADFQSGYEGSDAMFGNGGADILRGWSGNDTLDGGAGIDTAAYFGPRSNVALSPAQEGWTVTALQGGSGTDSLAGIERIIFGTNEGIALDLDGNAGLVAKLLGAVFGAAMVQDEAFVGIGLYFADLGMGDEALAALAMSARGMSAHGDVVETLWLNVIGSPIDDANKAAFVGLLDGGMTVGALTLLAANTTYNQANIGLVGLAQTGLDFQSSTSPLES